MWEWKEWYKVSKLTMTFWPNPVRRNHTGEMRWYFNVALRAEGARRVRLYQYRGEWYDADGRLKDVKEASLDIELVAQQPLSYPDLWVSSAIPQFSYRMVVFGRDDKDQDVRAEAVLRCE